MECSLFIGKLINLTGSDFMDNKGIKEKFAKLFDDPNRETFKIALNNLTGEYDDLEFKEQEIDEHILAKHILGIANTSGGVICLGIKESDDGLIPIGINNSSDSTDLKKKLSKYLPYNLDYEVHPIDYDDKELWGDVRNKSFKIITVEYTPEYIPFMPMKDHVDYKRTDIFCRKNSSTNRCEYDDLQNILNKRVSASQNILNIIKELNELELLMKRTSLQYKLYYSINNPDFLNIISQFKEKKIKRIEKGLGIEDYDEN